MSAGVQYLDFVAYRRSSTGSSKGGVDQILFIVEYRTKRRKLGSPINFNELCGREGAMSTA
jgi:hypothetical protein